MCNRRRQFCILFTFVPALLMASLCYAEEESKNNNNNDKKNDVKIIHMKQAINSDYAAGIIFCDKGRYVGWYGGNINLRIVDLDGDCPNCQILYDKMDPNRYSFRRIHEMEYNKENNLHIIFNDDGNLKSMTYKNKKWDEDLLSREKFYKIHYIRDLKKYVNLKYNDFEIFNDIKQMSFSEKIQKEYDIMKRPSSPSLKRFKFIPETSSMMMNHWRKKEIEIYSCNDGKLINRMFTPLDHVYAVGYSPKSKLGYAVGWKELYSFEPDSNWGPDKIELKYKVLNAEISIENNMLIINDSEANLYAMELDTQKLLWKIDLKKSSFFKEGAEKFIKQSKRLNLDFHQHVIYLSPCGKKFAVYTRYSTIRIFDINTGEETHVIKLHE